LTAQPGGRIVLAMRIALLTSVFCASLLLTGCAVNASTGQQCTNGLAMSISPASATADHAQTAPANQAKFQATVSPTASPGCAVPNWVMTAAPTWTNPDPKNISINSSSDTSANGVATCLGTTNGMVTQTVTLTCK